mmetsp:Transcript_118668/g.347621  ORF Transcript_118668/g.347621 Transcript_118668/m.347621 type:complete len:229 (+) Transcript_118668:202-888(+)
MLHGGGLQPGQQLQEHGPLRVLLPVRLPRARDHEDVVHVVLGGDAGHARHGLRRDADVRRGEVRAVVGEQRGDVRGHRLPPVDHVLGPRLDLHVRDAPPQARMLSERPQLRSQEPLEGRSRQLAGELTGAWEATGGNCRMAVPDAQAGQHQSVLALQVEGHGGDNDVHVAVHRRHHGASAVLHGVPEVVLPRRPREVAGVALQRQHAHEARDARAHGGHDLPEAGIGH